jgi:repressor LexA
MAEALNRQHREILSFILRYFNEHHYPPTVREIGKGVGMSSPSSVQQNLDYLQYNGFLTRERDKPRTIKLILPKVW